MEKVYKFLLEQMKAGTIKQETTVEAIKLIKAAEAQSGEAGERDIAIIGMALKLPNAESVDEYWENVTGGLDCITTFPESRKSHAMTYLKQMGNREEDIEFCESAYLDRVDCFDYGFFKLSPKEASLMEPTQRMFLEVAWKAIEDAGYGGERLKGTQTGVYVGFASNLRDMYAKIINDVSPESISASIVGNLTAMIPSRISYLMDLKGPSMVIDAACSSSLVAVATACQAMRLGSCEMALVGGINVNLLPIKSVNLKMGIESSDGRTRAFDDHSDGAGIGEGIAAILLKPLSRAQRDKDQIYGVIKGAAVNQDGTSIGITAPNPAAQTAVIEEAWKNARVNPETITYIETHGTGTNLGDPIEIKGISKAFEKYTDKKQFCGIGSVKTNIGHLSEAAGVVSLIKAVMALKHKTLPPQIYFGEPNQTVGFAKSPLYINTRMRPWEPEGGIRRCGVSAFGISGTNVHVVLEEGRAQEGQWTSEGPRQILSISSQTQKSLMELVRAYHQKVETLPEKELENLCYTANTGRNHFSWRCAVVFGSKEELLKKLDDLKSGQGTGIYSGHFTIVFDERKKVENGITEQRQHQLNQEVLEIFKQLESQSISQGEALEQIAQKYVAGAEVPWGVLYGHRPVCKISAPTYAFEKHSCWVDLKEPEASQPAREEGYFTFEWIEKANGGERKALKAETLLYIKGPEATSYEEQLIEILKNCCRRWIVAEMGQNFKQLGPDSYVIGPGEEDYLNLIEALQSQGVQHIVHGATLGLGHPETPEALEAALNAGVYSLFYLTKALVQKGMENNMALSLIGQSVNAVKGEKTVYPDRASFFGLGKTIVHEHNGMVLKCIDIDEVTSVEQCIEEIFSRDGVYQVALRNGKRYVEKFTEIEMENVENREIVIKEKGVYLITGGTGGIGLEVSKRFAAAGQVNLIWIGRKPLPDRNKTDLEGKALKIAKAIEEIEQLGTTVTYYTGDIGDPQRMAEIFEAIETQFGTLTGIVHSAGMPGDGFLVVKSKQIFDLVLRPKVNGTWLLGQLSKRFKLDFFILFSSGLSMLSEPGHGDYTAANSYLDAFALYLQKQGIEGITVNWTSWKETGMAVDHGFNYDAIFKAITTQEALTGLETVMTKAVPRALVGRLTYNPQFLYLIDRLPFELSDKIRRNAQAIIREKGIDMTHKKAALKPKTSDRIELKGRDGEAFSQVELELAQIYNAVLGFEEINIYDNFFELGGDSVMLNQMVILLDQAFPGKVKLIDLFNYTTIADLAQYISGKEEGRAEVCKDTELAELEGMLDALDKGELDIEEFIENVSG